MKLCVVIFMFLCFSAFGKTDLNLLNISCDNMEIGEDGTQILKGNVRILYESIVLTADTAKYNDKKDILEASGMVRVLDNEYILNCSYMITWINEKHTIAKQNPYIVQQVGQDYTGRDRMYLSADVIEIFSEENRVLATGTVKLTKELLQKYRNTEKNYEPSVMWSDSLEMFMDDERSIARGNVRIQNKDFQAFSDQAMYYTGEGKLILTGNARAVQDTEGRQNKVYGQKIVYFFDTERVIIVRARADVFPQGEKK